MKFNIKIFNLSNYNHLSIIVNANFLKNSKNLMVLNLNFMKSNVQMKKINFTWKKIFIVMKTVLDLIFSKINKLWFY